MAFRYLSSAGGDNIFNWIMSILDFFVNLHISSQNSHEFQVFAIIAMDSLWYFCRNQIIHTSQNITIDLFVSKALKTYKDHHNAYDWKELNSILSRTPSPPNHFTIYFDVAVRSKGSASAAISKAHGDSIEFVITGFSMRCNPHQGETMAAFIGVKEAHSRQLKKAITEGDSQKIITAFAKTLTKFRLDTRKYSNKYKVSPPKF